MTQKLDFKLIFVAIGLLILAYVSFNYWRFCAPVIFDLLDSRLLTFGIWTFLGVTLFIHYQLNHSTNENQVSDKDGLERPVDYLQYGATYGAIGTSIQVISREVFANYNFPELSKCSELEWFDGVSFLAALIILSLYCYVKLKPIIQETFLIKSKVETDGDNVETSEQSKSEEVVESGLKIISAIYFTDKESLNVTEEIRKSIVDNKIDILASNDLKIDPDHGTPKKLNIKYNLDGVTRIKQFKEGDKVVIP